MALMKSVSFNSEGKTLAGHLFLPSEPAGAEPLPGIVVTGSWTTVKEQMADRYARRLADWGMATLSFDFRSFGESEGAPRDLESPAGKAVDIRNAFTYLDSLADVDSDRLGALGVCASAGYQATNTAGDSRVRSLALVAPWLHNAELVRMMYGGDEGVNRRLDAAASARSRYEESGEVEYVEAISETDPSAAMTGMSFAPPNDYYTNPARAAIPEWPNRFAVMGWTEWLNYDPIQQAERIAVPTVMVHSEDAAIPQGAKQFYERLAGDKSFLWTTGSQLDFYDQQPQVTFAVRAVVDHFRNTL